MKKEGIEYTIDQVKEQVINTSLVVASIIGGLAYFVSIFSRLQSGNFNFSMLFETIVLLSLLFITIRRKFIVNSIKAYIMVALILFLSLSDALFYGIFSSTRVYLVLVPLYSIIYFPFIRSLLFYLIAIVGFVVIGYFHHIGHLVIPTGYEPDIYVYRMYPWIINAIHISSVGLVILYVTRKFFMAFSGLIIDMEGQNIKISENERNYREIFNSTTESIFIHNAEDGQIYDVNEVMLRTFGLDSKEEALRLSIKDISATNDQATQDQAQALIQKAVNEGSQVFEWVSKKKNGELFHSEISLKSTNIGGEGRVLAVLRDITDRKKMEQSMQASEERYRTLVETSQDGISMMDMNGVMLYVNNRMAQMVGAKSAIDLIGQSAFSLLTKESEDDINELVNRLLSDGYIDRFEAEVRRFNGTIFSADFNLTILKDSNGDPKYMMVTMRDITERKFTEKALTESKQLFQNLSQMSPVGIYRTESNGDFAYVNPRWTVLSGLESEEALGEGWLNAIHPEDREFVENKWRESVEKKTRFREEFRYLKKDGSVSWVIDIAVPDFVNNEFKGFIGTNTNVTKRTLAELALKQSEQKYRTLMESLNEVIIVADNDHVIQYVNKKFTEKLGYMPEEIVGKVVYTMLHSLKDQRIIENANRGRIEKRSSQYELRFIAKNGSLYDFIVNGAPLIDDNGKTIGSIGAMVDITEFNKVKKEIQQSEEKYRVLFENAHIGIYQTTPDGKILKANPALINMLFYDSFDDLVKLNIEDDGAIVDANRSVFKELIEKNGYVKDFESKWRTKDGRTILVVENARLVRDKEGNNLYYDGFVINVTDRKMAEMALKESEERYRTIIEAFPEIIMVSDLNSNIIFANEALEQITGITPADYSNQNRKAQIHPDDAGYVKHEMRKLIVGNYKHTSIIENRFIDSVGKIHWFSGIFSKIYINNQMYIQTITRDITNKKIAEDELEKYKNHLEILVKERTEELETANEELNATNEELYYQREELEATLNRLQGAQSQLIRSEKMASLGVLAAGVAHEINNPLNFIQGGASALETFAKENLDEKINEVKQYIDIINEGVHRAAQIVKGLNHYSRTSEKHNTSCNLHTIINNCILMLNNQIKNRVTIEREFTLEPFTISCNEGKLHQAILNLISNAVQSIENKGTIRIKTRKDNKNIQIIIADSGCGISSDNLSKIRDPFFTTKAPGRGTGLGLSITSNIIEEHDGSLDFESELGKGTKVYINLPMK